MFAGKGLSTRQIAEVTGRDQSTIVRDLKRHVLPFGAWPKSIMKEGDACSIDGRRGTWQEGKDGYLYCVPVDESLSGHGLQFPEPGNYKPGTREYVDQVWHQMVLDQQNAWRNS